MLSRYLRFYNGKHNKDSLLWWVGTTTHEMVWSRVHAQDHDLFETVRTAGSVHYDQKKKQLVTYDFSTTLNLVSNPEDGVELSDQLLNNCAIECVFARSVDIKSDTYASDFFVFETEYKEALIAAFEGHRKIDAPDITFRRHDNKRPFLVDTDGIAEKRWLDYAIGYMA